MGHKAKPEAGDHHVDDLQDGKYTLIYTHHPWSYFWMRTFLETLVKIVENPNQGLLFDSSIGDCTVVQLQFTHRKYHNGKPGREKNEVSEI